MGQIEKNDILIIFSYSGNTLELTNMLKYANRYRIKIIGAASKPDSILLKASDINNNSKSKRSRYYRYSTHHKHYNFIIIRRLFSNYCNAFKKIF